MERVVKLDTLEDTCIPVVFRERTWTKLQNPVGVVYSEIIKEFFLNASVEGDRIDCRVRHKEFIITRGKHLGVLRNSSSFTANQSPI